MLWHGKFVHSYTHFLSFCLFFSVRTECMDRSLTWDTQVCDVARASTAISALSWLAWAVTFVFGAISVIKGRNGSMSFGNKAPKNKEVDMHQGV